jgi:hypothetical protein
MQPREPDRHPTGIGACSIKWTKSTWSCAANRVLITNPLCWVRKYLEEGTERFTFINLFIVNLKLRQNAYKSRNCTFN